MQHIHSTLLLFALRSVLLASQCHAVEPGYIPLLDRDHTDGWVQIGPGRMQISDGISTNSSPTKWGVSAYSKRMFSDFVLKLEFRGMQREFNSGVWIRFVDLQNLERVHSQKYEVGIRHSTGDLSRSTGAIWATQPAFADAVKGKDWNEMEITVAGQRFMVKLNGRVVNDSTGNKSQAGYIGLEENFEGPVQFRNVRIKDLSAPAPQVATASA